LRRRNRVLVVVVAIILFVSLVIAGYIYTSPPLERRLNLSIVAEDHAIPSFPETGLMILCPSKARGMGLCNTDERDLHVKYGLIVRPSPPGEDPWFSHV